MGILYRLSEIKTTSAKRCAFLCPSISIRSYTPPTQVATSDENNTGVSPPQASPRLKHLPQGVRPERRPLTLGHRCRHLSYVPSDLFPFPSPRPRPPARKTTITVHSDARDRICGRRLASAALGATPRAMSPAHTRAARCARTQREQALAPRSAGDRATDFYDDYLDSYAEEPAPAVPPVPGKERVANWARNNAVPGAGAAVGRARSVAPNSHAPSSEGATLRRKTTRRTARPARSTYYEEEGEEGYANGDYEDAPFEMIKIRVKVRCVLYRDVVGTEMEPRKETSLSGCADGHVSLFACLVVERRRSLVGRHSSCHQRHHLTPQLRDLRPATQRRKTWTSCADVWKSEGSAFRSQSTFGRLKHVTILPSQRL